MPQRGVILVNLGTPASATAQGVRDFLRAFLSDRRVVDVPRWLWWPLLHGVILPLRSRRVAKAYAQIWQPGGSPLMVISRQQQVAVQEALQGLGYGVPVELAMSYGEPSGDVLRSVMQVDPQPPVKEKADLLRLTEWVDQGLYDQPEAVALYQQLAASLGEQHPQLQRLQRSRLRQKALKS